MAFLNLNCGKGDDLNPPSDDNSTPTEAFYNIIGATIDDDGYTAPWELSFLYSTDNGESYTAEKPTDLSKGSALWVKINDGENDISDFEWHGIIDLAITDTNKILATFEIEEGSNPALVEFDTDGVSSKINSFTGENIPCCGLGLSKGY